MKVFTLSMDIGEQIIKSGGEIHRAEDTIRRINAAFGKSCKVFALPTVIIAECDGNMQMRKINREELDLSELERLNALSRRICRTKDCSIDITVNRIYSQLQKLLSVIVATFSFSIFFGGSITDGLFAAIIGLAITYIPYKPKGLVAFSSNLIDAFIAGILSQLPAKFGINASHDKIIIGAIMLLVPGLTVVSAMRDMMNGDLIAGIIELFSSIMSALAIALGIAGALLVFDFI